MPTIDQPVIVRSRDQGCVYGLYQWHTGREVCLKNARQIWNWQRGRLTLFEVATKKASGDIRLSVAIDEIVMLEACGILACTDAAAKSLAALPAYES